MINQYVIWTRMTRDLLIAPFIVKHFLMYWMNYYSIFCIYFLKCYKPWCHIGTNFIVYFTFMFYIQKYTFVSVLPLSVKLFFYFDNIHNVFFQFFLFLPLTSSEIHGHELTDMQDWPWVSKFVSKKVKCFLNKFYIIWFSFLLSNYNKIKKVHFLFITAIFSHIPLYKSKAVTS